MPENVSRFSVPQIPEELRKKMEPPLPTFQPLVESSSLSPLSSLHLHIQQTAQVKKLKENLKIAETIIDRNIIAFSTTHF